MKATKPILMLGLVSGLAVGCGSSETPSTSSESGTLERVQQESREAVQAVGDLAVEQKNAFVAATDQKLAELDQHLQKWEAKVETYTGDAKQSAQDTLARLKTQRVELQAQFDKVKQSTASAWDDVKAGFAKSLDEIEKAFSEASEQFQDSPAESGTPAAAAPTTSS